MNIYLRRWHFIFFIFCYIAIFQSIVSFAQNNRAKSTTPSIDFTEFKKHYVYLSSTNLKNRLSNTTENLEAVQYLANKMKEMGLKDIGKGYKNTFSIPMGQVISHESVLTINNQVIKIPSEAYPLAFSDTIKVSNSIIGLNNSFQNVWILPAYESNNETRLTHEQKEKLLYERARGAKERGATAIIFYNNLGDDFVIPFKDNTELGNVGIPVYEAGAKIVRDRIKTQRKLTNIVLHAKMKPIMATLSNVVGYIDNQAKETILISSNIDGNNLATYTPTSNTASGMATVLYLAQHLRQKKSNYNYIFAFFNATHNGLEGAKKLLQDVNTTKSKVIASFHYLDVGVMDETKNTRVSGVGTYTGWKQYFSNNNSNGYDYYLENKGSINSDIIQLYNNKIPYLSFASAIFDPANVNSQSNIDYNAVTQVILKTQEILTGIDNVRSMPTFSQTEDISYAGNTSGGKRISKAQEKLQNPVSLGVLPDLEHKEGGILIGKVNKGTPADRGGLMVGDIIMQIRNFPVQHYDDYLAALNHFKQGDKIFIKVKRKGNVIQKIVTF